MLRRCSLVVLAFSMALPALGQPEPAGDEPSVTCEADWLIDAARAGFATGSPAFRTYLRALLKEAAPTMSIDALLEAIASERTPEVLEALGAALASRASFDEDPTLLQGLLARATGDGDPAVRAAAVRALRATGSVETLASLGDVVGYAALIRDPDPGVRAAVAENLVAEQREVYGGSDARLAKAAVEVVTAAADPAIAGRVLAEVSLDQADPESVAAVTRTLSAEAPELREGTALALGSAPPADGDMRAVLVERYRREAHPGVRAAILQALARLGQASAIPTLRGLRGVAPELDPEIDAWLAVLGLGLQEWHLILREHLRRKGRQQ